MLDIFEQQVFIYENATTGTIVGHVKAYDMDRDSKFLNTFVQIYTNIYVCLQVLTIFWNIP